MYLTLPETLMIIGAITAATMLTRFLPFILFPENKEVPAVITYFSKVLPPAMIGLLVAYCLKNLSFTAAPFALPELAGIACIIVLHFWKRNTFLSIFGGTFVYIAIVNLI